MAKNLIKTKHKKQSVTHYDYMIESVEKHIRCTNDFQDDELKGYAVDIVEELCGETFNSQYCILCQVYAPRCNECPADDVMNCCDGLWHKLSRSKTLFELKDNLKAVREFLNNLEEQDG